VKCKCQETTDNLKQQILTYLLQLIMFLLICVTVNINSFKTVILYVARMQAWRRLRHWSMPSSVTLCYTRTHAPNRCRHKQFTVCFFWYRLAAPDFVMKCIEAGLFGGQKSGSSTGLLHYCTFRLEEHQMMHRIAEKIPTEFILKKW